MRWPGQRQAPNGLLRGCACRVEAVRGALRDHGKGGAENAIGGEDRHPSDGRMLRVVDIAHLQGGEETD